MVRITPPGPYPIEQGTAAHLYPAGSEMNVAVAAAHLGLRVSYVTKVANNPLGRLIINKCSEHKVDTTWVRTSQTDRQGLLFFENAQSPRAGTVYYDRENSVFSKVESNDFEWDQIVKQTKVFLISGINPAVSTQAHRVTLDAVRKAKAHNCLVAFDTNYRSKLWDVLTAKEILKEYYPYIDMLFTSGRDARSLFGFHDLHGDKLARKLSQDLAIPTVVLVHSSEQKGSLWRISCVHQGEDYSQEQGGRLVGVERLGAGDAMAGGFITGFLESGPELGVVMGNASMTLKNTYVGDFTWVTREIVDSFIAGDTYTLKR